MKTTLSVCAGLLVATAAGVAQEAKPGYGIYWSDILRRIASWILSHESGDDTDFHLIEVERTE